MQSLSFLLALWLVTGPELDAARKTRALLEDKLAAREKDLRARVVALYKLETFGELPAWVDDDARRRLLERRGAARRLILRDLEERRALRADLQAAQADEARLATEAERAVPAPRPGSLRRPVPGRIAVPFGVAAEPDGARLPHRGVELVSLPGQVVGAVGPGRVAYVGPIRGLGESVVVDHGAGLVSVVGGLARARVAAGDPVAPGGVLGAAAGDRIHLEIRAGTRPIDPAPLLPAP
jgi:septal ring factor EnvC (AmiA/AmiB activator)